MGSGSINVLWLTWTFIIQLVYLTLLNVIMIFVNCHG
jgi:hypothetical protein